MTDDTPPNTTTTATPTTEPSKLELGKNEEVKEEEAEQKDPLAKYDDDEGTSSTTTYNETMTLLNDTSKRLDAFEQKEKTMIKQNNSKNNNPSLEASGKIQQTASARDYYRGSSQAIC
jgi:phage antirepressor YoqD-like protein